MRFTERKGDAARMGARSGDGGVAADLRGGLRRGRHDPGGRGAAGGGAVQSRRRVSVAGIRRRRGVATISRVRWAFRAR